jgi:hypothetical protein
VLNDASHTSAGVLEPVGQPRPERVALNRSISPSVPSAVEIGSATWPGAGVSGHAKKTGCKFDRWQSGDRRLMKPTSVPLGNFNFTPKYGRPIFGELPVREPPPV